MKKIVFVFNSLGIGGSQKIEAFVANACKEYGYDVSIISLTNVPVGVDLDKSIPINYVEYNRDRGLIGKLKRFPFILRLRKAIKKQSPDMICVFLSDVSRVVTIACKGLNIPIIASERSAPQRHGKKFVNYKRSFEKCKAVVFQTETAQSIYNLKNTKTYVIPNPCFLRWGEVHDLTYNKNTICAAGRLCRQKRFDVLIDAFSIVHAKYPDYKLFIYGSGNLMPELNEQIKKLNLCDSVELPGYVKDVFHTHGKPDIFVLSSDYEGIPNILMEALCLGIACVSTDCEPGGADLLFDNQRRGLLSPIGDSVSLANNIIKLIEDNDLSLQLMNNAREVSEEFSVTNIKNMWLELFRSV